MKTSCEIIKDLLPLYSDEVCSKESRALVEEHIAECASCTEELERIKKEFECPQSKKDEAKPLRAIAAAWKKDKSKAFLKGTAIALLVCAILAGAYIGLTQLKIFPVSADLLEITEISQLADGRIVYHLYVNDDRNLHFIKFTTNEDGSYYMTPMRAVIEGKRVMDFGLVNHYFTIDIEETNAYQKKYEDGTEITSCYVGPEGDGILIWEEGIQLPPASEEIEKMLAQSEY